MAREKRYSRLNPAYLGKRHAGMFCMCLALGLLAGVAWRSLAQPTRYAAKIETAVSVTPIDRAPAFDWSAKQAEWETILRDRRDRGLLLVNLRHALKLAVTKGRELDVSRLSADLAEFKPGRVYSALMIANPVALRFGPVAEVTLRDLAVNMDFQSLAVITADLAPSGDKAKEWDFAFFSSFLPDRPEKGVITELGPDDPYFRVFYTLYKAVHQGAEAVSPAAAWQAAVDELAARLELEAQKTGGGGFGPHAKRELMRELAALPSIAANRLLRTNRWLGGGRAQWFELEMNAIGITLRQTGPASGIADVGMTMELHPFAFPRDTVVTRLPPLTVATVISFLSAREAALAKKLSASPVSAAPAASPKKERNEPAVPQPDRNEPEPPAYHEIVDETANQRRLAQIAALEETIAAAVRDKNIRIRRLDTARGDEKRLSFEAIAARSRADRLQERHIEAAAQAEADYVVPVSEETARLLAARDAKLRRLKELLTFCTEEHPFVRALMRDLEALEAGLGTQAPDPEQFRQAEARATRAVNLRLEWESADSAAEALEERRRRQAEQVGCLQDEVTDIECIIAQRETDLAAARRVPVPVVRIEVRAEEPVAAPVPTEPPVPAVAPAVEVVPGLVVDAAPTAIPLLREPPGWIAVWLGLCAGLTLGLLWALLRELFAQRFSNTAEARRMVQLPVLASLPAYDPGSIRFAARTMKGELLGNNPRALQFVPALIELFEPPAEARRGKIVPLGKRARFVGWALCFGMLVLAGMLQYRSQIGFMPPKVCFDGQLPLPAETVPVWSAERGTPAAEGGDQP